MRQAYIPFVESYEEDPSPEEATFEEVADMPMEGKKSCMAEAYKESVCNGYKGESEGIIKFLN